jgi:hypothetical protein
LNCRTGEVVDGIVVVVVIGAAAIVVPRSADVTIIPPFFDGSDARASTAAMHGLQASDEALSCLIGQTVNGSSLLICGLSCRTTFSQRALDF